MHGVVDQYFKVCGVQEARQARRFGAHPRVHFESPRALTPGLITHYNSHTAPPPRPPASLSRTHAAFNKNTTTHFTPHKIQQQSPD